MTYNSKQNADFVHYLESMVNLDALDRMTRDLDDELQDSRKVMNEIKGMIDTLPMKVQNVKSEPESKGPHEDISCFMSDATPKLVMNDMNENTDADIDLDDVIATMKCYTEDLKKNFTMTELQSEAKISKVNESLDLGQYASSLDLLSKRLAKLKLNKKDEMQSTNAELAAKVAVLCDDVNIFTKMVHGNTTLGEANKNWSQTQQQSNDLQFDNLINKLLSEINEVTYLLYNKN